ncbi:hypothetical protein ACFE04_002458 [Oxalis oulophora]
MEVELKLRLRDSKTHETLISLLTPFHKKTYLQQNLFFDTKSKTLLSKSSALRLRFYDIDSHCILSLKSNPTLQSGLSRVEELEEPIEIETARKCVNFPDNEIMKRVKDKCSDFGDGFVCLGGFKNVRGVYEWKGLKLEIDETVYDFGICYEIECETDQVERDREVIEGFLKDNGVEFQYSKLNKFGVFMLGKLPDWD